MRSGSGMERDTAGVRVLVAVACGVALASLVVAALAWRSAERSQDKAEHVAATLSAYEAQVRDERRAIRTLQQQQRKAAVTT